MCGIFGCVLQPESSLTSAQLATLATKLFLLSESRGKEASGFAIINEDEMVIHKTPFPASDLVTTDIFRASFQQVFNPLNPIRAFIGHSRLVTDGYEHENRNNQPVVKHGLATIHNGIIVNKQALWQEYTHVPRETELDSELIPVILHDELSKGKTARDALQSVFEKIYGMTNIALLSSTHQNLFLATNNGSIYYVTDPDETCFIFASERHILQQLMTTRALHSTFDQDAITQLRPLTALSISLTDLSRSLREIGTPA